MMLRTDRMGYYQDYIVEFAKASGLNVDNSQVIIDDIYDDFANIDLLGAVQIGIGDPNKTFDWDKFEPVAYKLKNLHNEILKLKGFAVAPEEID